MTSKNSVKIKNKSASEQIEKYVTREKKHYNTVKSFHVNNDSLILHIPRRFLFVLFQKTHRVKNQFSICLDRVTKNRIIYKYKPCVLQTTTMILTNQILMFISKRQNISHSSLGCWFRKFQQFCTSYVISLKFCDVIK